MLVSLAAVAFGSCQKDEILSSDQLKLKAEDFSRGGTKVIIDGNASSWASGDEVRINDKTATVNLGTSGQASVSFGSVISAPYYGVYPAGIYVDNDDNEYTLNLPAEYTYAVSGGKQNLQSPMVAYAASGNELFFRHVTAAIGVQVVNYYGFTIAVDSVVIISDSYKLSGSINVTLDDGINVNATSGNAAEKKVKMRFDGAASLQIYAGDSATVQVPVLPVGSGNHFTIKTYVHKVDQADVKKTLERTQSTGGALARAHIGYARFTTPGLFSVDASHQVIIAQGNLMYNKGSGVWSFMTTQYGREETSETDMGINYANHNIISLFGWGTSGWDNGNTYYQPYYTVNAGYSASASGYGYGPTDGSSYTYGLTGTYVNADWGYNAISNGGNVGGMWRVPAYGEFNYILSNYSRGATNTVNGVSRAKFTFACVNDVNGVILFPDVFDVPSLSSSSWGTINGSSNFTSTISLEDWYKLEASGAVFLPATGMRNSSTSSAPSVSYFNEYGYYWSGSNNTTSAAYAYQFAKSTNKYNYSSSKYNGHAVRLMRPVN